jgi:cyclic pyranopterin phosphate synthase
MNPLSHINTEGQPAMVAVGDKPLTKRTAKAQAIVALPAELVALFDRQDIAVAKGPVFQTAIIVADDIFNDLTQWVFRFL